MPIRVCFLIDNLATAGTELFLLSLLSRIDRNKVEPHLCLLNGESDSSRALEPHDVPVIRLGVRSLARPSTLRAAWRLRRYLRANRIQIVHTFFVDSAYFGAIVSRMSGITRVLRTRRNIGYWVTPFHRRVGRFISPLIATTTTNCRAAGESVVRDYPRSQVEVIPNGIDVSRFDDIPDPIPTEVGGPRRVGIVANLRPIKSLNLLIEAAGKLQSQYPDVVYQLVGDGELRPQLEEQARQLGVADKIQFLGRMSDVRSFLAQLDVAVLCSSSEGISNAILEYMSAARPIVATAVGGTPELITHEQNGLLVPSGDADALAREIGRLLTDRQLACRLGRAARRTAREEYSREVEMERYEALYERLAAVPASGPVPATVQHGQGDL